MAVAARRASSESEIRLEVHHVVLTFHPPLRLYNLQVLALILEQHGSAPDCRSFVKRSFVIRRKTEIRRLREKSKCLSSVVHFCFDSFAPFSSLEDTYGRKMEERNVEELCEKSTIGHPRRARMQESVHRF